MQSIKLRAVVGALTLVICAGNIAAVASAATRHHQHAHGGHSHGRKREHAMPGGYGAWSRVADCESGGWQVLGSAYPDSLGINRANWLAFGGKPMGPGPVGLAGQAAEIRVADRLIAHYNAAIPDQYGCGPW